MPVALLSACLWDLRAQCEQHVRALMDAQQQLDVIRDRRDPVACEAALKTLQADLDRVVQSTLVLQKGALEAVEQARSLHITTDSTNTDETR
jgi:hypothetical protein